MDPPQTLDPTHHCRECIRQRAQHFCCKMFWHQTVSPQYCYHTECFAMEREHWWFLLALIWLQGIGSIKRLDCCSAAALGQRCKCAKWSLCKDGRHTRNVRGMHISSHVDSTCRQVQDALLKCTLLSIVAVSAQPHDCFQQQAIGLQHTTIQAGLHTLTPLGLPLDPALQHALVAAIWQDVLGLLNSFRNPYLAS